MNHNIILITLDAVRADHLKIYGYSRNISPNIDLLGARGLVFKNCYSNGPDTPSGTSSILTSYLPFSNGGYSPLPSHKIMINEFFKLIGYKTIFIHNNPNLSAFFNYNRGWDTFIDYGYHSRGKITTIEKISSNKAINYINAIIKQAITKLTNFGLINKFLDKINELLKKDNRLNYYDAKVATAKVIETLKGIDGNFFLWVHYMDTHHPFYPPGKNVKKVYGKEISPLKQREIENKREKNVLDENEKKIIDILYDAEINHIDEQIGELYKFLKKSGLVENTIIILTADHGEELGDHGYYGHQGRIFNELLKIPLIFSGGLFSKQQGFIENPVMQVDILPTLLDYFGISSKKKHGFEGISLIPSIKSKSREERKIISECFHKGQSIKRDSDSGFKLISVIDNGFKYIFDQEDGREYLFNIKKNPDEKIDIKDDRTDILEKMRKISKERLYTPKTITEKIKINDIISKTEFKL
ncbi:MAG: sulfatase [Candidatus Hodarchaeota archaeon]